MPKSRPNRPKKLFIKKEKKFFFFFLFLLLTNLKQKKKADIFRLFLEKKNLKKTIIKFMPINNNKFNLPPVPVPLMGLRRLIPFIRKTLSKRKPNHKPCWRDNSVLMLGRQWFAFYLAKSLYIKPTDCVSRIISHYPFFFYLLTLIFISPLSFKI